MIAARRLPGGRLECGYCRATFGAGGYLWRFDGAAAPARWRRRRARGRGRVVAEVRKALQQVEAATLDRDTEDLPPPVREPAAHDPEAELGFADLLERTVAELTQAVPGVRLRQQLHPIVIECPRCRRPEVVESTHPGVAVAR